MFHPIENRCIATVAGAAVAFNLQKWGWRLQAKRLVLQTLSEIEERTRQPSAESAIAPANKL